MDLPSSGVQDQPDEYGEGPSLLKIQKLAGHGGGRLWSQLLGRLRQENGENLGGGACSELRLRHWTPAWATGLQPGRQSETRLKTKQKTKWGNVDTNWIPLLDIRIRD